MKAVILAAGEGTRINQGWTIVPKPLLEIDGLTLIERVLLSLKKANITDFLIVTGFMSEHVKDSLRDGAEHGVSIKYLYNEKYKEDKIHSLAKIKEHVSEPFILCMADLHFDGAVIKKCLDGVDKKKNYVFVNNKLINLRRVEEKEKIQADGKKVKSASINQKNFDFVDCGIYFMQPETVSKAAGKNDFSELISQEDFDILDVGDHEIVDVDRDKDIEYILRGKK